ncbi:hypothetical protein AAFF_G00340800 [Aldrovandia affinis]|uniref:Uncharacterized protein n=1 Tax=Aldrovandia affinis TaxID=143900 RepID=A0AAD7WPB0_9TELE|nr:hypothetical protein AAFF_G00340800 [Aldrovandia affinis]
MRTTERKVGDITTPSDFSAVATVFVVFGTLRLQDCDSDLADRVNEDRVFSRAAGKGVQVGARLRKYGTLSLGAQLPFDAEGPIV